MTDNEIIKALNTAADKDFVKVYLWDDKPPKVTTISVADIADLINRQNAEIDNLSIALEVTRDNLGNTREELNNAETEIERLKYTIVEEHSECDRLSLHISNLLYDLKTAKAEAIKEFAERLKANTCEFGSAKGIQREIDNLVKEMVGDAD